jgi:hypothetical protein
MIPFDMDSAVQRNMSTSMIDVAMQYVGCFNTTQENCNQVGGTWKGNETGIPGTRIGCFEIMNGQCACDVGMCAQTTCDNNEGMMWWSDCLNCQCSGDTVQMSSNTSSAGDTESTNGNVSGESSVPVSTPPGQPPISSGGSLACYGVGGTFGSCDCSTALCNQAACEAAQVR